MKKLKMNLLLAVVLCATELLSYGGLLPGGVTVNGRVVNDAEWRHEADGEAFRYRLPQGKRVIASEDTVWTLPEDALCWYQVGIEAYEMAYSSSRVRDVPKDKVLALPITFKLADGSYRLITEVNLVDYTDLAVVYEGEGRFRAVYHAERGPFEQSGADTTPWRVTIKAKNLNELYNCDLVRRLCPEPTNEKSKALYNPGRCIWQWLPAGDPVYAEQKDWYDKTAALGFEYYLIDDGWKNWRDGEKDQWACLKSAIGYGKSVGVKTAMWVDSKEMPTAEKRRAYLKKVVEAGAVGIKIDFMPPCDSKWCKWYEETLADTAELGLFVDFHGAVKPTGREKTWPHELAREAIRGHEWHMTRFNRVLPPEHDAILPFCRLVQGHGDYTPVVFQKDQLIHFTWPRQMAQGIVMAAPFLCLGDYPQNYLDSPMAEVIKALPATYDETIVLPGSEIGECVALARRAGSRWFIAVENGAKERHIEFDLGFLGEGKWSAVSFCDDPSGRLDACERKTRGVSSKDFVKLDLRGCGGFVAMLEKKDLAAFVDPFVGTAGTGHTFPAACVPFGLVQAGPDTGSDDWDHCSGYNIGDRTIYGFSQTHLNGTGGEDLGDILIAPFTDGPVEKGKETAAPGFYSVEFPRKGICAEATASEHVGFYRFSACDKLLVDCQWGIAHDGRFVTNVLSQTASLDMDGLFTGVRETSTWNYRKMAFALATSRPIVRVERLPQCHPKEKGRRYVLHFGEGDKPTLIKVSMSASGDVAQARRNLAAEIQGWDFDAVKNAARQKWNEVLGAAVIEGTDDQKKNWYTSLYHLCIQPNNVADFGERPFYSTFSCWDTFRAAGPMYTILYPDRAAEFVDSMLEQGKRTGYLPIWTLWGEDNQCMIGTHSVPMIVDWFLKDQVKVEGAIERSEIAEGLREQRKFNLDYWQSAYQQIKETLTKKHEGRIKENWDIYDKYGYYPFDKIRGESVSRTMECAYDDWCAGVMAEKLGHKEDAAFFFKRSAYWKNVFDMSLGLVRGKDTKGKWREPFDPYALGHGADLDNDFTEGNAFQYSWHVMQDVPGFVAAMGGKEKFVEKLDALFKAPPKTEGMGCLVDITGLIGQYVHGNEPSHHVIYFYPQVGHPEKAAERIREVFDKFYLPKPDGLCGNDDCGQMSAWYLFSAMGFYPFNPCGGEYIIGAPQIEKVTLHCRPTPSTYTSFTVIAKNLSKENKYVKSVTLNGKPITDWKIRHEDIMKGGELVFEMEEESKAGRELTKRPDYENPEVNSINRLPPRTYAMPLADLKDALTDELEPATPYRLSLNGDWKYAWAGNPELRIKDFWQVGFDDADWFTIDVPSCVEMRGFGSPGYTNMRYPHANLSHPKNAAFATIRDRQSGKADYNPVSSYRRTFMVPGSWKDRRIILRFDGVYSAYYVWVNGKKVGYAEDSKLPSEFDITSFLNLQPSASNLIAVEVYRWCDGSYLEDQDMTRFSGIFRDVTLWAMPKDGIWDFVVKTKPVDGYGRWNLEVKVKGEGEQRTEVSLYDADRKKVADLHCSPSPSIFTSTLAAQAWSAEKPYLYTLVVKKGEDIRMKRIGFKEEKVVGNAIVVNGRKIKFKGVNRHETSPENGRTVSLDEMVRDITLMKRYNINTVRTSHYPNHRLWYDLCDRYGIYLVAEANVEGHEPEYRENGLGIFPEWEHTIKERNLRHVAFYRNHPSVTFWSMGNETGDGDCFRHTVAAVKALDSSRIIHWERGNKTADVDSRMYPDVEWIEARGRLGDGMGGTEAVKDKYNRPESEQSANKAFFMCEYAHAMGNAIGNFEEYWQAFYRYDSLAGGCIWDWIDQAIWKETDRVDPKTGKAGRFLAYGGDFDEQPNDGPFNCNGVIDPERRVTAKLVEVGHVHRNLVVTRRDNGSLELWNRFGFTSADEFDGTWELLCDGRAVRSGVLDVPTVAPLSRGTLEMPDFGALMPGHEYFLNIAFHLKTSCAWAEKGWTVARDQIRLDAGQYSLAAFAQACPEIVQDEKTVMVSCGGTKAVFCRRSGTLCELEMDGRTVLKDPAAGIVAGPRLTCARAFTDNDIWLRGDVKDLARPGPFYASGLTQLRYHARPIRVSDGKVVVTMEVTGSKSAGFTHTAEWSFGADGAVSVCNTVVPHGTMPVSLPRLGLSLRLDPALERMRYHGRGPYENYIDRCTGSFVGVWESTVSEQYEPYVRPQDCGYKSDVRWVEFLDEDGRGVHFAASEPMFVQALHYAREDLEFARHRNNQQRFRAPLVARPEVCLNLDVRQLGLGGASCGPKPMDKYRFPVEIVRWTLEMTPLSSLRRGQARD